MNDFCRRDRALEELLRILLQYGTWLASAVIGVGLILATINSNSNGEGSVVPHSMPIATAGIILFILLPTLRVLTMLVVFLREGRFQLAANAALVLAILALSFLLAVR